jgi:SecD/SecF fusion protein
MAHDVIILVGIFAWLGKPIDGVFLAALLTVIGYSVNDTVVVFDRVRELWASAARKMPFAQVVNRAVLQTVPRTVNTGLGAVFILAALALLGGDSLTDFAVALLIGIAVGTYSSMFTASPHRHRVAGAQQRPAAPPHHQEPGRGHLNLAPRHPGQARTAPGPRRFRRPDLGTDATRPPAWAEPATARPSIQQQRGPVARLYPSKGASAGSPVDSQYLQAS